MVRLGMTRGSAATAERVKPLTGRFLTRARAIGQSKSLMIYGLRASRQSCPTLPP
jgi:hypothetical protein